MAGLSGKTAWIAVGKQTVKGSLAATPAFKSPFSGGNIQPTRETDRLAETDVTRDQGAAFITVSGVEGTPELYVRDDSIGAYLLGVLGTVSSDATATPNIVHTFTPNATLPYYTFWRNVGGSTGIWERFTDCKLSSLTISAEAGQPLTAAAGIVGLEGRRLVADPAAAVPLSASAVYNFNNASVELGGVATRLVRSFELTIENNVSAQQTDDVLPYDVVAGQREISLGFDMLFETLDEYNKFHYGGAAGTTVSPNIYTTDATFTFTLGANNEIVFELPSIAYEEFPVEPDPGGDPIIVSVRAVAQKATGVANLITATLKNQTTSY